jgi:hypothetical protein
MSTGGVRRRRRFPVSDFQAASAHYQNTYDLTPEAADIVAAISQSDGEDVASALLVLTAMSDAHEESGGGVSVDEIKARHRALRRNGTTIHFWEAVARDVVARESD